MTEIEVSLEEEPKMSDAPDDRLELVLAELMQDSEAIMKEQEANLASAIGISNHINVQRSNQEDPMKTAAAMRIMRG